MAFKYIALIVMFSSFLVTGLVYPFVLRFAKRRHILDNPNERKVHRSPVPLLGGIAVWTGIVAGSVATLLLMHLHTFSATTIAMTVMLVVGTIDDIKGLTPTVRFLVELVVIWVLIAVINFHIDSFHGLWGIGTLAPAIAIPLSLIAGVGIINAVNLIDGVDGYSSGFGIMAALLFSVALRKAGMIPLACISLSIAGGLIPFFLHNVFGYDSKMYIGDGGTLMLGTAMAEFVFSVLFSRSPCIRFEQQGISLVAMCLAIMSIPVFDTLRVMIARIRRGKSPFSADKTHLHHLFLEFGFSHIGTTLIILAANLGIFSVWYLSWKLGAGIDLQFYIVVGLSLLATVFFYRFMYAQLEKKSRIWELMCRIGAATHRERSGLWKLMRRISDRFDLN